MPKLGVRTPWQRSRVAEPQPPRGPAELGGASPPPPRLGPHGLGTRADRIVEPAENSKRPVLVDHAPVGREEPSIGGERCAGRGRVVAITLHERGTAEFDPASFDDACLGALEQAAIV